MRKLEQRLDWLLAIVSATETGEKLQRFVKKYRQNLFVIDKESCAPVRSAF